MPQWHVKECYVPPVPTLPVAGALCQAPPPPLLLPPAPSQAPPGQWAPWQEPDAHHVSAPGWMPSCPDPWGQAGSVPCSSQEEAEVMRVVPGSRYSLAFTHTLMCTATQQGIILAERLCLSSLSVMLCSRLPLSYGRFLISRHCCWLTYSSIDINVWRYTRRCILLELRSDVFLIHPQKKTPDFCLLQKLKGAEWRQRLLPARLLWHHRQVEV